MEHPILEWSIRAALMAIGTGLVVRILRINAATIRHRAWAVTMAAMLLLPLWTNWGPSFTASVLPAVSDARVIPATPRPLAIFSGLPPLQETAPPAEPFQSAPAAKPIDWQRILLALYLAGVAAMLIRLIAGTLRIRSLLRHASEDNGFVTTSVCAAPVTIGWLRPILLLPDSWRTWSAAKLETVLIHEREHIRRRDPLVQWLALLNRCVFWFHPLAWWLERKLAALAEEACDAAVLARGHAAADYSRYLIEMARSINERGARIRGAGAVAFSEGNLPERIRRIMDAPSRVAMSRAKSIASVSLCASLLTIALACNIGRKSTMAQQEHTERAEMLRTQQQRVQSHAAVWNVALNLTSATAQEMEADLKTHPHDADKLLTLVRHYQARKDLKSLDALTLWFIGEHPDVRLNWSTRPAWDQVWDSDIYDQGRQLWTEQLKKSWDSPYAYMNAAEFLSGNDNEQAEQILVEGRRRFPATGKYSGLHWEVFLARHYAWALTGGKGQLPADRMTVARDVSDAKPDQSPYAQRVRAMLLASPDADLLFRVVEQLQGNRPNLELTQALIERVLSIEPDDAFAHHQREHLKQFADSFRLPKDSAALSDSDRIARLQSQLDPPVLVRTDPKDADAKAHELIALASRNTKDPNYGTAVFLADMELGQAAMKRGDKAEAVRLLLAASEAPPSEYLRYNQLDMSLPATLVDAGERGAVATFLDRCARFSKAGEPLARWAVQIRMGTNPRLMPTWDFFRKAG